MPIKYKCFGARHQLSQLPRIEDGLKLCGAIEAEDQSADVDFVYANDEPRWQEAIDYRNKFAPNAKLILCVLDIPEHNLDKGYDPFSLLPRLQKADAVVSISQWVQNQLIRWFNIASRIIYQPIKPITNEKRLSGVRPYPYRAMMVGRLRDPNKRSDLGIRSLIYAGFEENEVAIVGGESLGWGTDLGVVSDQVLNDLYNSVDFVMAPSLCEGLYLPVLESVAGGALPIVCHDLTTWPEFNLPSRWASYPSIKSLGQRLRLLIDNDNFLWKDKRAVLSYTQFIQETHHTTSVAEALLRTFSDLVPP